MSDTMKITVEVEVPDKEDCADCPFLDDSDRYDNDGYKRYVDCNLFPNDRGFLTKENTVKKFPSCLAACQKAEKQEIDLERVTAERDAAVNELSALKEANQWISVEERFPEPYVRKLVKLLTGFVGCASYSNLSERWLPDSGQPIKTISAWRDLPEVSESEE